MRRMARQHTYQQPASLTMAQRLRLATAINVAHIAGGASRRLGHGGGTSLPGLVALAVQPQTVGQLAAQIDMGSILIVGTNGKTTTARLLSAICAGSGLRPIANRAGANLLRGIGSTLVQAATPWGTLPRNLQRPTMGVFEVDEAALPAVARAVRPRVLVAMNLFRDQLDRYGELDSIVASWHDALASLAPDGVLVANADDPLMAWLGRDLPPWSANEQQSGPTVLYYGLDDAAMSSPDGLTHTADSLSCLRCGHDLIFSRTYYGHLGLYHCPACGQARPRPSLWGDQVTLRGMNGASVAVAWPGDSGQQVVTTSLPGLYNVYNTLAACAAAAALHIAPDSASAAMSEVRSAFGRAEQVEIDGCTVVVLLIKNPVGATEALRLVRHAALAAPIALLGLLNDNAADGHDVSWIWDMEAEMLRGYVASLTCGGRRAADLAVRFKYAGVATGRVLSDIDQSLDAALATCPADGVLYALATYTAMLDLRAVLTRRGHVRPFWQDQLTQI